jgi:hypothetical protein
MPVQIRNTFIPAGGAALLLALYACGGSSESSSIAKTTHAYQGAGSSWALRSSSDGTCTLAEADSNLKINATCSKLSSGFTKITVTSASGDLPSANEPAPPEAGDITYAFEVDGYMMPFKSFGEGKVVPTVSAGNCVTSINHNYIVSFAKLKDDNNATFAGWSHLGNYTIDSTGMTINGYQANGTKVYDNVFRNFTLAGCSGGLLKGTENGEVTSFYLTQNGGAILHQDRTNSTSNDGSAGSAENDFMLPATNDVATLAGLDGNYIGFAITSHKTGTYNTTPVSVAASNGAFTVSSRTGTDLATATAGHSSFTLATKVSPSLYRGSLTHTNAGGSIGCAINSNIANQTIVICSGIDPADPTNKTLFSVILKSAS